MPSGSGETILICVVFQVSGELTTKTPLSRGDLLGKGDVLEILLGIAFQTVFDGLFLNFFQKGI